LGHAVRSMIIIIIGSSVDISIILSKHLKFRQATAREHSLNLTALCHIQHFVYKTFIA